MDILIQSESDYRRAVGQRLRLLIRALGIPYVEAAADMDVSRTQLGNWMRGTHGFPRHYELYKFCRKRGVNTDWIYLADPSGLPARVRDRLLEVAAEPADQAEPARQAP